MLLSHPQSHSSPPSQLHTNTLPAILPLAVTTAQPPLHAPPATSLSQTPPLPRTIRFLQRSLSDGAASQPGSLVPASSTPLHDSSNPASPSRDAAATSEAAAALLSQFGSSHHGLADEINQGEDETEDGFELAMPGGLELLPRTRPRRIKRRGYAVGARVRYMRTGESQGCMGTIVDAKCGYWVISMDNKKQLYARGALR